VVAAVESKLDEIVMRQIMLPNLVEARQLVWWSNGLSHYYLVVDPKFSSIHLERSFVHISICGHVMFFVYT